MGGVRIVRLEAEQIKRINAISIEPSGNVVVIGGKCGQGKTTTIDLIWMALKTKAIPGKPVRDGAEAGVITLTLSNGLTVKKTINASGNVSLTVTNADGFKAQRPQELLDSLIGSVSLDPLAFIKMGRKEQYAELARVVGLDFSGLDAKRKETFEERSDVNRRVRDLEGRLRLQVHFPEAPAEEESASELIAEVNRLTQEQTVRGVRAGNATHYREQATAARRRIEETEREIGRLERLVLDLHDLATDEDGTAATIEAKLAATPAPDIEPLQARMAAAEDTNRKVRANRERAALAADCAQTEADARRLTEAIAAIDADKQARIAAVKLPLPGVSFGDEVVLLNGQPVDQAGGAEQIAFSTALTFASNPGFPVARIDHGNDLDEDGLRIVAETAAQYDGQVWMAWVGTGPEVSVVIEDGAVKETRPAA